MLTTTLGRHVGNGAFQNLQQSLLHALARYITGDGGILAFTGDLIQLINIDDTPLCQFHIEIGGLDQTQQNIFHVLTHVTGFGQRGSVGDGKRHLHGSSQRLSQMGFTAAGRSDHQDIALLDLHIILRIHNALIVVINRHAQGDLGSILSDDVLIQRRLHFSRRGQATLQIKTLGRLLASLLFFNQFGTDANTLVADIGIGTGDQPFHFILGAAAETAAHIFLITCHISSSFQRV